MQIGSWCQRDRERDQGWGSRNTDTPKTLALSAMLVEMLLVNFWHCSRLCLRRNMGRAIS